MELTFSVRNIEDGGRYRDISAEFSVEIQHATD